MKTDTKISGSGKIGQGEYNLIKISGSGAIEGPVTTNFLIGNNV